MRRSQGRRISTSRRAGTRLGGTASPTAMLTTLHALDRVKSAKLAALTVAETLRFHRREHDTWESGLPVLRGRCLVRSEAYYRDTEGSSANGPQHEELPPRARRTPSGGDTVFTWGGKTRQ